MSLEQLIDAQRVAKQEYDDCDYDNGGAYIDTLKYIESEILRFVLEHADIMIEWERQHAARLSFDDYEIGT